MDDQLTKPPIRVNVDLDSRSDIGYYAPLKTPTGLQALTIGDLWLYIADAGTARRLAHVASELADGIDAKNRKLAEAELVQVTA